MKINIYLLLLLIPILSCRNNSKVIQNEREVVVFDTIVVDYDLENERKEKRNSLLGNLSIANLIDTLKSLSEISGIIEINESGLPFTFENKSEYYSNNIPSQIYSKIFPFEEIELDKTRYTNSKINEKDSIVTIQKGLKIIETRKYKTLLSVVEKKNYVQLLLTKQGKYAPEIDLITVSKKDLSKIDDINLFGGIYDSYDIDYRHSKFDNSYDELIVTNIKNTKFEDIKLDTLIMEFMISHNGTITKK